MRRWAGALHRTPELAFAEHRTTELIRSVVGEFPGQVTAWREVPLPTSTGACFLLDHGPGPVVLLRVDIDALPIVEDARHPSRSERPGVMHACGHDLHTAMALGLMKHLTHDWPQGLKGRVAVLFQPAEETLAGARAVDPDTLLSGLGIDKILSIHVTGSFPAGVVSTRAGPLLAGVRGYAVVVRGGSGHGAVRRDAGEALAAGAHLAGRLPALSPRPIRQRRRHCRC